MVKIREFNVHSQAVYNLNLSPITNSFFSSGSDGKIIHWNTDDDLGELFAQIPVAVFSMCIHDHYLICGTQAGTIFLFNIPLKKLIHAEQLNCNAIFNIAYHESHYYLATQKGELVKLNIVDLKHSSIIDVKFPIRKLLFENEQVYIGCSEGKLFLYDLNKNILKEMIHHQMSVFALALVNEKLFSGGREAKISIWKDDEVTKEINAHWYAIKDLKYNKENNLIISSSMDKTIKLWEAENMDLLKVIDYQKNEAHQSSVNKILWIDRKRFISCSDDKKIILFEINN